MDEEPRLPYGYEDNVHCTEGKDGIVVIHWPEGCRGTVISRELLDQMVEDKNNQPRWIPVSERKPDCDRVLFTDGKNVTIATRYAPGAYDAWDVWEKMPTHWMPMPEPPKCATH